MRELIMDGEAGLAVSHEANHYYERHGIKFLPRAQEQQVAHIDRRGALLRDTIDIVSTQCEAEGLDVESKQILNDCIFSGNASLSINGSTPYNAVYGRVPQMLLDTNMPIDDAAPGTMRHVQRMREISIQAMVEGTAQARAKRALNTKTRPAGQSHDYKIGDLVDFHRAPSTKYASGWRGPANTIDNTNITRGTLTLRYQRDMPIEVRLQDVRRHLDYLSFMPTKSSPMDAGMA